MRCRNAAAGIAALLSTSAWAMDELPGADGCRVGTVPDQSLVIEHVGADEPVLQVRAKGDSGAMFRVDRRDGRLSSR